MKVAVVGGGLGGLLVAAELRRRGAHPTLFEASDRVGGVAATRVGDGFTFEPAAGSFPLPHLRSWLLMNQINIKQNFYASMESMMATETIEQEEAIGENMSIIRLKQS